MKTILCIEDEPELRLNIVEELEDAGYTALEAGDGAEGLTAVRLHRPDLVLCDVSMPVMDGRQFLAKLRGEQESLVAATPLVFLSALGDSDLVADARAAGADAYLVKPVSFSRLLSTIANRLLLGRTS